jgi:hypothetical protein
MAGPSEGLASDVVPGILGDWRSARCAAKPILTNNGRIEDQTGDCRRPEYLDRIPGREFGGIVIRCHPGYCKTDAKGEAWKRAECNNAAQITYRPDHQRGQWSGSQDQCSNRYDDVRGTPILEGFSR